MLLIDMDMARRGLRGQAQVPNCSRRVASELRWLPGARPARTALSLSAAFGATIAYRCGVEQRGLARKRRGGVEIGQSDSAPSQPRHPGTTLVQYRETRCNWRARMLLPPSLCSQPTRFMSGGAVAPPCCGGDVRRSHPCEKSTRSLDSTPFIPGHSRILSSTISCNLLAISNSNLLYEEPLGPALHTCKHRRNGARRTPRPTLICLRCPYESPARHTPRMKNLP